MYNMYITICEIDDQSKFDAWIRAIKASALGQPWGMGWRGRWVGGSGWGTHVHPWLIHVTVWQKPLQYWKVISLQLNKFFKKGRQCHCAPCSVIMQSSEGRHFPCDDNKADNAWTCPRVTIRDVILLFGDRCRWELFSRPLSRWDTYICMYIYMCMYV